MSLEERLEYAAMKARHAKKLRPWHKKWWGKLILFILGLFLILIVVAGLYIKGEIKRIKQLEIEQSLVNQQKVYQTAIRGDGSNYSIGALNQPLITIVEFSDFACPFCQQSVAGLKEIFSQYSDKVRIVFRDYPLHDNSVDLALAARCAGEQNKFWEMHDLLFANQDQLAAAGETLGDQLSILAQQLKLSNSQFNDCLETKKYLEQIRRDFEDGEALQIDGTPTWFINENRLTGYVPDAQFVELISALIEQKSSN